MRKMFLVTIWVNSSVAIRAGLLVQLLAPPALNVAHEKSRLIVVWVIVNNVRRGNDRYVKNVNS